MRDPYLRTSSYISVEWKGNYVTVGKTGSCYVDE